MPIKGINIEELFDKTKTSIRTPVRDAGAWQKSPMSPQARTTPVTPGATPIQPQVRRPFQQGPVGPTRDTGGWKMSPVSHQTQVKPEIMQPSPKGPVSPGQTLPLQQTAKGPLGQAQTIPIQPQTIQPTPKAPMIEPAAKGQVGPETKQEVKPQRVEPEKKTDRPKATEIALAPSPTADLKELNDITMKMAKGQFDDAIFQKSLNKYISNISLYNQAAKDALSQQIAADPNLKGQGLGYALLHMAGREAGYRVSDMLAQLSVESMDRIIKLQTYGIDRSLDISNIKYGRTQDALNREEKAEERAYQRGQTELDRAEKLDQTEYNRAQDQLNRMEKLDERDYRRTIDLSKTLLASGDFAGTADTLNSLINTKYPQMAALGVAFTEEGLRASDEREINDFLNSVKLIEKMAQDPDQVAAATAMLSTLMLDPIAKDRFPEGMTAEQIVNMMVSGKLLENAGAIKDIREELNRVAISGDFDEAGVLYEGMRDAGYDPYQKIGDGFSFDKVNEIRAELGYDPISLEEYKYADDEQKREWGQMSDFAKAKNDALVGQTLKSLTQDERFKELIESDPTVLGVFRDYASMLDHPDTVYNEELNEYTTVVPEQPWKDPKYYSYFYSWPKADFDPATGDLIGTEYYPGGDAYWMADGGFELAASNDDKTLDKKYLAYLNDGGGLTAPEWYFASSEGRFGPLDAGWKADRAPSDIGEKLGNKGVEWVAAAGTESVEAIINDLEGRTVSYVTDKLSKVNSTEWQKLISDQTKLDKLVNNGMILGQSNKDPKEGRLQLHVDANGNKSVYYYSKSSSVKGIMYDAINVVTGEIRKVGGERERVGSKGFWNKYTIDKPKEIIEPSSTETFTIESLL